MSQLQALQLGIDQAIFEETLACLPSDWTAAALRASSEPVGPGGTTMPVRIDGMGASGIAFVSDALQDRVRDLFRLNERFKTGLRSIIYTYRRQPDGRWSFNGDYGYS